MAESTPVVRSWRSRWWKRRLERDPILRVLHAQPLFRELSYRELLRLKGVLHHRTYERGEYLFEVGQPGAAMFVLVSGRVSILLTEPDGEDEVEVAELESGAFVGELALLDDSPRSASARCVEPTEAVAFFRGGLDRLLEENPAMGNRVHRALARLIGRRLRSTNAQLSASERARLAPAVEESVEELNDDLDEASLPDEPPLEEPDGEKQRS